MLNFLKDPVIVSTILAGLGWLINKVHSGNTESALKKVTAVIAACVANMGQYALTEPNKTPEEVLVAFKGIVAIEFAKAKVTDADRAPYEPLIRKAIAEAMELWVKLHPDPSSLTMPITKTVGNLIEKLSTK